MPPALLCGRAGAGCLTQLVELSMQLAAAAQRVVICVVSSNGRRMQARALFSAKEVMRVELMGAAE